MKRYYAYILASRSRVLYVGVTKDLERRVHQHKQKLIQGFTARYNVNRLVYFEETPDISSAILREKQLKGWTRAKKVALIESVNPQWRDLSEGWEWHVRRDTPLHVTLNEVKGLGAGEKTRFFAALRMTGGGAQNDKKSCHPERSEGSRCGEKRRDSSLRSE